MSINSETIDFLNCHLDADPLQLLLKTTKYPQIDMKWVAQQIEGKRQAKNKWPLLSQNKDIWYPPKLNREQSSSEATAQWKSQLIPKQSTLADLTGGMGIDSLYFAKRASTVHYIEFNSELCEIAQHNYQVLQLDNIACNNTDSIQWLTETKNHFDTIYIDPARRNAHGQKVAAFEDCTPNLLDNIPLLLNHCQQLIIKASPMIDIATAEHQLPSLQQEIILAVKGECKEILFICSKNSNKEIKISCYNLDTDQPPIQFTHIQELNSVVTYATKLDTYLYEPNAAIMKAGAYNTIADQYQLKKLARNTHLYTSNQYINNFPGRIFEIKETIKLNAKYITSIIPTHKAHVISRNHPISAPILQQKLKLSEGGDQYIIATTLASKPIGILCTRK